MRREPKESGTRSFFAGDITPTDDPEYAGIGWRSLKGDEVDKTGGCPSYERVQAAAALWRMNGNMLIVPSGGDTNVEGLGKSLPIAEVIEFELCRMGVLKAAIILEPRAYNTWEQVRYCAAMAREHHWDPGELAIIAPFFQFGRIVAMIENGLETAPFSVQETAFISMERALAADDPIWNTYFQELYDQPAVQKTILGDALGAGQLWTGHNPKYPNPFRGFEDPLSRIWSRIGSKRARRATPTRFFFAGAMNFLYDISMNSKQSILVIAAHPDDEVLGAGGAMARHAEEGDTVTVLILGEGIAARAGVSDEEIVHQQRELNAHASAAALCVGAQSLRRASLPDNAFDTVSLLSIVHEIEKVVAEINPTIIYTHHIGDTNIDHRITAEAVDAVVRPMEGNTIMEVRAFEVPSSSEWNFTRDPFRPNVFIALSEGQLKRKIEAMKAYVSEIRAFPHPRSPEYLESLARVRGGQSGFHAAEAFVLVYARHA